MNNSFVRTDAAFDASSLCCEDVKLHIKRMLPVPVEFDDEQNLLELGLDSLQIMRLVSRLRRAGLPVTFAELIASPRLRDWWQVLQSSRQQAPAARERADQAVVQPLAKGPFPLTDVQYAYWIGRRDDQPLGGVGCHAYVEMDGTGVEPERLEKAWKLLLQHHAGLRTRFRADGQQEVMDRPCFSALPVHDWRHCREDELQAQLSAVRARLSHRRLNVEHGEVAGLELSLLPEGRTRLHFDIDLLVADVQSLHICLRDLAAAYASGSQPPAPQNWSFAAYIEQAEVRKQAERKRAAAYWQERLPTLPAALGLPLKTRPEAIQAPVFRRRQHVLTSSAWALLQKRAAAHRVTPAMVLLTAYAEVLDRWSAQSQFLINVPLFDRETGEAGIEDVIADFTNLLLLEVDCGIAKPFADRVRDMQEQFHRDAAHTAYSGVQLQRDLARLRQGERDFAPVVFACNLGTPLMQETCRQAFGELTYMISQTPQVWLDFQIYEADGGLLLAWDAVEQLFPDGLIDQMFGAFIRLMDELSADHSDWQISADALWAVEQRVGDDAPREASMAAEPDAALHAEFFRLAAANPGATALIDGKTGQIRSYGELADCALRIAAFLRDRGVCAGDPVAVTLPRGIEQIAAVLGILAAGACYVPIGIEQPASRRGSIHRKAAIRFVLTDADAVQAVAWPADSVVLCIREATQTTPLPAPLMPDPQRLAYIIFTSGSTGEPKGVEISHAGAWNTISDINRRYGVGPADRMLAVSSLDFDLSVYDIFGLLGVGGSLVLIGEETRRDAAYWLKLLHEHRVTLWNSVPILLDMLLVAAQSEQAPLPSLRLAMLSGDWIGLDLPQRLREAAGNSRLVAMGGATEASIWSNYFDVALPLPEHWTSIPYGQPLTNQRYRIIDDKGRDCPPWAAGELWIGGAGVALGYRGDPALSAERFVIRDGSRWYRTGDLGRYWPDGTMEFLGRKDFQIKIRGHRIELGEIESALRQHEGVREAVVAAHGDPRGTKQLAGYIVPEPGSESELLTTEAADAADVHALWERMVDTGRQAVRQAAANPDPVEPEKFPALWERLERLSVGYMCQALRQAGACVGPGETYTLDSLMSQGKIQPRYRALVRQWLALMEHEGFVRDDGQGVYTNAISLPNEPEQLGPEDGGGASWSRSEQAQRLLACIRQIGGHGASLLQGAVDPLELIFSEDGSMSPDRLMQALPGLELRSRLMANLAAAAVQGQAGRKPVRILEIGARSSSLTNTLLDTLPPDSISYTYTDSSAYFLTAAQLQLPPDAPVQYRVLDIDQSPEAQGFAAHSYDLVIAPDSLHRARHIGNALRHIRSLLSPGGLLVAAEMTRNSRLQQITTGFLEDGFTRFEDERQATCQPLLSAEQWRQLLQAEEYAAAAAFPEEQEATAVYGQHVIAARAPERIRRFHPKALSGFLSQKIPEYMIPAVFIALDKLPLTSNGKVNRQALPVPAQGAGAEKPFAAPRTPVEQALAAIWSAILGIGQIGLDDNFFELGGDSLLAIKLSAKVREKLDVALPLGRIFEGPTIAGLAEHVQASLDAPAGGGEPIALLPQIAAHADHRYLPFPLTDIQQAYWLGRSGVYALGQVSTHCYFELEGTGLELERINRAWQRLIEQHDMMRAVVMPDGQRQVIFEQVPAYRIRVTDLREQTAEAAEADLHDIREEMSHQLLAADKWPLFDVRASLYGDNRVRLHISFDNLLFDGWSMFHLLSEWSRLYHQPEARLPDLDLSFRDYVLALEELKTSESYQRDQAYWLDRLAALPPAPELPLAQAPEAITQQRFRRLDAKLSRASWRQLRKRAAEAGLTPSGVLLAAYAEALAVWSRRPTFTINLTQFNRLPLHPQVGELVGDFTSLTLLAVDPSTGPSFLDRARNVQQQLWDDLDHPHVGGVHVQRELAKLHGDRQGAAMPVVFTSALGVDQWGEDGSGGKWLGKLVYNITQTPQVWLDHQVVEQDGELLLIWDAVEGLFPSGLLEDMFAAYVQLLGRITEDRNVWRELTPSLIAVPRLEARMAANSTEAPASADTLDGLFVKQAACQPHAPAVICASRTLTYEELDRRSDAVAQLVMERGAKPNTLVAVMMEKGWEQVVAALGILKAGAAYLPLDPTHPAERLGQIMRSSGVAVALTQSWLEERLTWPEGVERLYVDLIAPGNGETKRKGSSSQAEHLAYVIYTSGSTGVPKGVMIDHRGAVNTILDVNRRFAVGPQDRVLALSNLNFDLSVYDIFGMLAAGAAIVIPEADRTRDPARWLEWLEREQVTVWNTVPALMQMLLEHAAGRGATMPPALRLVLLSGDWIPLDLPDGIKAYSRNTRVVGLGGATEASIWSNFYPIDEVDPGWKSIPYGYPLANQRYHILNESMGDCPVWVPGQLYIGGIGLAQGYWQDASRTNERFVVHPRTGERLYGTGDYGRYWPDGRIEFLGREDDQVKIRGHRMELGEIEAALIRCDGIKEAVVCVTGESPDERQLTGFVVLDEAPGTPWLEIETADPAASEACWQAIGSAGRRARELPAPVDPHAAAAFLQQLEQISVAVMCRALHRLGVFAVAGERCNVEELMERGQLHPRYRTLLAHWLHVLAEEELLCLGEDGRYANVQPLVDGDGCASVRQAQGELERFPALLQKAQALQALFERGHASIISLLIGEIEPQELFLAEPAFLTPETLSAFNLARPDINAWSREVFRAAVHAFPADRQLRVLEIGSRAGGLTDTLAPVLPAGRGRYMVADQSSFFTDKIKQQCGEAAPLEYGLFDMNRSPSQQGYEPHVFDVIIADNTLHRARNLAATLAYLRQLLAPGGQLIFVEAVRNNRLMLTTVGFFEDGFSHLDDERQASCLPLLPADRWRELLQQAGFARSTVATAGWSVADAFGQHLIVAQAPGAVSRFQAEQLADALRRKLPDYMIPAMWARLEQLPLSVNGKVDRKALAALGQGARRPAGKARVAPSTETQGHLAAVWEEVLGAQQIGIDDSFFELGGDSLRAIQFLNLFKERYGIDLSLQHLFEAPTIAQLARIIQTETPADDLTGVYEEGVL